MIPEKDRERIKEIIEKEGVVTPENSYYEGYIEFIFNSFLYKKMVIDEELKIIKELLFQELGIYKIAKWLKQLLCKHVYNENKYLIGLNVPYEVLESLTIEPVDITRFCIYKIEKECKKCGRII